MNFLEKDVIVPDEKVGEYKLKLRAITRKQMRQLNSLVMPTSFKRSETKDLLIQTKNWEDYREQMILFTVIEPKLSLDILGNLHPKEFDKLFMECQEVNGLKEGQLEADEKKSESLSKEE